MARQTARTEPAPLPESANWLGFAGLAPQVMMAALVITGPPELAPAAVRLVLCYAALILSFVGGTWWGLSAQPGKRAGPWLWLAAVIPSLIAFACLGAWALGGSPVPGLTIIAMALVFTLALDARLAANGWCARCGCAHPCPWGWEACRG